MRYQLSMIQYIPLHSELDVDDSPIVLLPVCLNLVESVAFKENCMPLLERNLLFKNIILDCRQNTFISSSGIGVLVTLYKAARKKGIELILKNVPPQAMMVLELTQLDNVFTIELSEQYRVAHIHKSENLLPITHRSIRSLGKRFLDIIGGILGLGITAIAFFPIAIAIKLDSPGSISLVKFAVVGWERDFKCGNFAQCLLMPKP